MCNPRPMVAFLRDRLPVRWHTRLFPIFDFARGSFEQLHRTMDRRTLSRPQLIALLRDLGFNPGATVMVHSSFSHIRRRVPDISPSKLIALLQDLIGPEGTLLMPTFPFQGAQGEYADKYPRFDVQNTPSKVGILTEVFRQMQGVVRSKHPTHPVAAWGRHASEIVSTHHLGPTFGVTSPFYRLCEFEGIVVGLGTRYRYAFTIGHVIEELHPRLRQHDFEKRLRTMIIVDGRAEIPYQFHVLRPDLPREFNRFTRILRKDKVLRYVTVSGLPCAVVKADTFIRRSLLLAEENRYIVRTPADIPVTPEKTSNFDCLISNCSPNVDSSNSSNL
jgi:aminoglycoside 3-N-acetyltransferase